MKLRFSLSLIILFLFSAILLQSAQARETTDKIRKSAKSGFLRDYSELQKGKGEQAQLVYVNPNADFSKYTQILIDPVVVFVVPKGDLTKMPEEDLQACINYLYAAVRDRLSKDYAIVDQPGEGVVRLRIAITDVKGAKVLMNTISSVMPVGLAVSAVKKIATGSATAVGSARIEMELQDSLTEERLAAAVDARSGKKITGKLDKFNKYAAVYDAYDYWAEKLQQRLSDLRQGNGL
jgi:hypothetical protein